MNQLRRISQTFGAFVAHGYLAVLASGHIYKGPLKGVCLPFIGCYACPLAIFSCPVGSLQHFAAIRVVPFLLLGTLGLIGLLIGRLACGWLCPFGLLQDLLHRIPSRKIRIPGVLRHGKYLTLVVLVVIVPYVTGAPWFSRLCPAGTLTAGLPWVLLDPRDPRSGRPVIGPGEVGGLFALKLFILGAFLALFVLAKRPFCRTACPLGAIFSLLNRFSIVHLEVGDGCRGCGRCRERCPVDLQVGVDPNSPECIRCLNCTTCRHVAVTWKRIGPGSLPGKRETRSHGT